MTRQVVIETMNIQSMADALRARDDGMIRASEHAEMDAPGWSDRAYDAVCCNGLLAKELWWTIDYARQWLYACGLDQASSERAWGALTQRLLKDGKIERVGFERSASSRGSYKPTYRLVRSS